MFCQAYYHSIYIYTDNLLMLLWMSMYDIYTDNLLMLLWMSMYDIYTDNLLMLLWMSMYDHKCSQHHASFHMYSIFLDKWQALTNTMPATLPPPPPPNPPFCENWIIYSCNCYCKLCGDPQILLLIAWFLFSWKCNCKLIRKFCCSLTYSFFMATQFHAFIFQEKSTNLADNWLILFPWQCNFML